MSVLAFDCAGRGCSAAIVVAGRIAARRSEAMERGQAEMLMPMIETVLAEAQLALDALDLVAVTTGPGSFTGLRIGLAAARGLALASGLPAVGVTSFAAIAASLPPDPSGRPLAVALDSRREDIFLQCFAASGAALGPPRAVSPDAADAFVPRQAVRLAGDAAPRLAPALGGRATVMDDTERADPAAVARVAAAAWRPGTHPPLPAPLYLRAPDTSLPRPRGSAR